VSDKYKGSITLWLKTSGNYMSHAAGISLEQIKQLDLKPGDRLLIFPNNRKQKPSDYDMRLVVAKAESLADNKGKKEEEEI
jgi:hypothetical protein